MSLSSLSDSVFISSIEAKRRPFMGFFNLGNRKKSQGAKSGEDGGWGMITVLFLAKKLRTSNDEWAGQNSEILERTSLPHPSEKIAWHEPTDMPTSSSTFLIVIRRFSITIFFTSSMFYWLLTCWAVQGERRHSPLLDLLWRAFTTFKHFFDLQNTHRMPPSNFKCFSALNFIFYTKFHA